MTIPGDVSPSENTSSFRLYFALSRFWDWSFYVVFVGIPWQILGMMNDDDSFTPSAIYLTPTNCHPLPRSTVADSDLIVCLSKGEVAEVGSPED